MMFCLNINSSWITFDCLCVFRLSYTKVVLKWSSVNLKILSQHLHGSQVNNDVSRPNVIAGDDRGSKWLLRIELMKTFKDYADEFRGEYEFHNLWGWGKNYSLALGFFFRLLKNCFTVPVRPEAVFLPSEIAKQSQCCEQSLFWSKICEGAV